MTAGLALAFLTWVFAAQEDDDKADTVEVVHEKPDEKWGGERIAKGEEEEARQVEGNDVLGEGECT